MDMVISVKHIITTYIVWLTIYTKIHKTWLESDISESTILPHKATTASLWNTIWPTLSFKCMMTSSNEKISALLNLCEGNPSVTGGFPSQRPVTRSFDVFFDLCLNGWVNNRCTVCLRRHNAHYDATAMVDVTMCGIGIAFAMLGLQIM